MLNKEANAENRSACSKGSGDTRKNSFKNGIDSNNGLKGNSNSNSCENFDGTFATLETKNIGAHNENSFSNRNMNVNSNKNHNNFNNNVSKLYSGDNLAANGSSSLESIISLNDSEPGLTAINNTTLALNEAPNSCYLATKNNTKSKGDSNINNCVAVINSKDCAFNDNNNNNNNNKNNINNNNYNNRMEALNEKMRKNSSSNSFTLMNKDKQQGITLPDLDKKKMSFCSNGSEAANKSGKNSSNHLELLNCLKQKELEILKAQKISERKNGEKLLSNILF